MRAADIATNHLRLIEGGSGVSITFTNSNGTTAAINAVKGMRSYEQAGGGVVIDKTRQEWFVKQADLTIDDVEQTPAREDTITRVIGSRTETWKVFGDDAEPPVEYYGPDRALLLIRTILRTVA